MAFFSREWRTVAASIFAVAVISGAYLLARGTSATPVAQASTETALLEQIANRDSTGDGLPDWEKSLYGIPLNATTTDYFGLGMTDGEAVAKGLVVPKAATPTSATMPSSGATSIDGTPAPTQGSLTDTFAKNFFSLYVSAMQTNGGSLTSDQVNALAEQALQQLSANTTPAPDFKTATDIKTAGNGPDALKTYADAAAQVLSIHAAKLPKGELQYLQDYMSGNDPTALTSLGKIASAYHDSAIGLAALTVPQELQSTHLALVNAMYRISEDANDFSHVATDPLTAMVALEQYPQTVIDFANAFGALPAIYTSENVTLVPGSAAAAFVGIAPNTAAKEAASQSTP